MRYWVYVDDKVTGPFEENQIPALEGFKPDTLVCPEIIEEGAAQEWVPANSVLQLPQQDAAEAVTEKNLDTGTGTEYVAATEVLKTAVEQTHTQRARQHKQHSGPAIHVHELLVEKITELSKEIEKLRQDIREMKNAQFVAPLKDAGYTADPFEKTITGINANDESGAVIAPAIKVASIAEDNTPPQMSMLPSAGGIQDEAPEFEKNEEPLAAIQPAELKHEETASISPSDIFENNNRTFDMPANEPLPAQQEIKPEIKKEEPLVPAAHDNEDAAAQTVTQPNAKHLEEDAAVVAAALDSLYKAPAVQPKKGDKADTVEFEDLIGGSNEAGAKETTSAAQTKLTTMPEIQLNEATSLISEFIPPSDFDGSTTQKMKQQAAQSPFDVESNVPQNRPASKTGNEEINIKFDDDADAAAPNSQNLKRKKPAEIKTNPLISPSSRSNTARPTEQIESVDQFGTFEETTSDKKSGGALKAIMILILTVMLGGAAYIGLVFANIAPDSFGMFKKHAAEETTDEVSNGDINNYGTDFNEQAGADYDISAAPLEPAAAALTTEEQVIASVKEYRLSSGSTLENTINAKHRAQVSGINWSAKQFDSDNYSITIQVPPASEQALKMTYKFNFNTETLALTPLTSDSKNILGVQ